MATGTAPRQMTERHDTERHDTERHEQLAEQLEQEADSLEQRSERLSDEIDRVRDDWHRKQADPSVPGAVAAGDAGGSTPPSDVPAPGNPDTEESHGSVGNAGQ